MNKMHSLQNQNKLFENNEILLATVAHDLKNPLVAINIAIQSLDNSQQSPLNDFQQELVTGIMASLQYMQTLIVNILDEYRFNNGILELHKIQVNFLDFMLTILNTSKYIFLEKHQTIKLVNKLKNPIINIDILSMRQVVNNLISNAFKYAPETSRIIVTLFEQENNLCFSIENKHGIYNEENIFKMFTKNYEFSSTGLGLYIVKKVISLHGGNIFYHKNKNTFYVTVTLPRK